MWVKLRQQEGEYLYVNLNHIKAISSDISMSVQYVGVLEDKGNITMWTSDGQRYDALYKTREEAQGTLNFIVELLDISPEY